jgi:MFS family permease
MFTNVEKKSVLLITLIYFFRMLGAFMIFPVLSVFADSYAMSTPFLIGLTLGVYGLTNAIMQIPFGLLSDLYGRRNIILIGLAIFLLGSIICASTDNIYYLILGRALQGAGAISGALMALLSDSTKENNRTISMAIVGVAIGAAFFSAFIIGPLLTKYFELSGLFVFIVILTTLSIFLISSFQNTTGKNAQFNFNIVELVLDKTLKPYYVDILVLHTILTSLFIAIPVMMTEIYLISINEFPQLYSSIFILSLVITLPLLGYDRKNPVLVRNISLIILSLSLIFSFQFYNISLFIIMIALIFYIGSFSVLEAGIPSSLSKQTNKETRGLTMSIYTSFQFFGTFLGGFIGGYLYDGYGLSGIFFFTAVISIVWVINCLSRNFRGVDIVSK